MRAIATWAAAIALGAMMGALSAWGALKLWNDSFAAHYGQWAHHRAAGSAAAGPYTRAIIAQHGLLALNAREAHYFTLNEDEQGRPLDEACVYELAGPSPPARWWSVTLYARDEFLAQNNDSAASVDASGVGVERSGHWRARISAVRGDALDWISSRNARRGFTLTLRLYNTPDGFRPSAEVLPTLTTLSCPEAQV